MITFVSVIHVMTCVFVVLFILLQDPKGGVLGTLGGGGGSKAFFGTGGASPFLVKATKWLAIIFACSSFYLSYMGSKQESIMEDMELSQPAPSKAEGKAGLTEGSTDKTGSKGNTGSTGNTGSANKASPESKAGSKIPAGSTSQSGSASDTGSENKAGSQKNSPADSASQK